MYRCTAVVFAVEHVCPVVIHTRSRSKLVCWWVGGLNYCYVDDCFLWPVALLCAGIFISPIQGLHMGARIWFRPLYRPPPPARRVATSVFSSRSPRDDAFRGPGSHAYAECWLALGSSRCLEDYTSVVEESD